MGLDTNTLNDQQWFHDFLTDQANIWEREAEEIDLIRDSCLQRGEMFGWTAAHASAETFRAMASAYRNAIPTEDHEWDQTLADIVDLPEAEA